MLVNIDGDILDCKSQVIAHQANCVSKEAGGLAKFIFKKFPWADTYSKREDVNCESDKPGTITVLGNGKDQRYVINMYAQFYPGKAQFGNDTKEKRIEFFQTCLDKIAKVNGLRSIAFPYQIGCGLAGGVWETYRSVSDPRINSWACA
jgi:O-acetyl-ADP-ribose deacetylase (regulator of RNase III)